VVVASCSTGRDASGNSRATAGLGTARGRKPNPQAGKTSCRRLVGQEHGAPAPRCEQTASSPRADFGAFRTFFRLTLTRPAPGFSSRTVPSRFSSSERISERRSLERGPETCCVRRTPQRTRGTAIASGRSRASVGKRQRKRQGSRQVTDLPCDRQAATAPFPRPSRCSLSSMFPSRYRSSRSPLTGRCDADVDVPVRG
jgi:hypothetical protein